MTVFIVTSPEDFVNRKIFLKIINVKGDVGVELIFGTGLIKR